MANQDVMEGEVIEAGDQYDPDLNAAFYAFIDSVDTEANGGGQIAVFEVPVDHKGLARARATRTKLFTVPIGTCTYEEICERVLEDFMKAGETMIIQLMGTRDGRRGVQFNKQIRLRKSNNADKPAANMNSDLAAVLRVMQENSARDRAEMRTFMQSVMQPQGPQINPLEFGMAMASKLTELAGALQRPSAGASIVPGVPAGSPMDSMLQMMTAMKMMKQFMGNDAPAPTGESLAEILKSVGEMAKPLLGAYQANALANAAKERRATLALENQSKQSALTNVTETAPSAPQETIEMKLLAQLKEAMPALVDFAEQKAEVSQVASLALQTMPDDNAINDALYDLLKDDACLKKLALLHPGVDAHREWFEKFRVALLAEFEPDAPETPT